MFYFGVYGVLAEGEAPSGLKAKTKGKGINISWQKAPGNDYGYYVLRSESAGSGHQIIQFVSSDITSYQDNDVKKGQNYYYMVKSGMKNGKQGSASNEATAKAGSSDAADDGEKKPAKKTPSTKKTTASLEAPAKVKASSTSDGIMLTWKSSKNADGYHIYRSTGAEDEDFKKIAEIAGETSYEDKDVAKDASNFYYVVAYNKKGKSDRSELASVGGVSETVSKVSSKGVHVGFEGFRDGGYSVNECACIKYSDRSVWISHADNNLPNYPPMVNVGVLPEFPAKAEDSVLGFGINKNYRFMFFYEPNKDGNVYISSSKFINSWTEWAQIGELPTPTGYHKDNFKFAFGVSPAYFCCVALDTKTMQTYEAVCASGAKSWSPWKSTGKIGAPRFMKGGYFFSLAYDDKMYYTVMQQPESNGFIFNIFDGTSWGGWQEGSQRPQMPEWLLR